MKAVFSFILLAEEEEEKGRIQGKQKKNLLF
jgi:hypothetical protein